MNPSRVSVEKEGGSVTINAPFGIYEIVVLDSEKKKVDSFNLDGYKKEGTETDAMFAAGAVPLRIGGWTLRVETAAIAGLGVLNVLMNLR